MEVTAQECWLVMSFPLPFSSKLTCVDIHRWFPFHETLIFSFFFFLWFKGLLRCGKSCRLRWINYLRADLKRGNITAEEEEIIIKLHASLGNRLVCLCLSCSYWNITCMWKMWYREALVCIGTGAPWKLECEAKKCIIEFSLSLSLLLQIKTVMCHAPKYFKIFYFLDRNFLFQPVSFLFPALN